MWPLLRCRQHVYNGLRLEAEFVIKEISGTQVAYSTKKNVKHQESQWSLAHRPRISDEPSGRQGTRAALAGRYGPEVMYRNDSGQPSILRADGY